jgi:hypothetical protein
MGFERNYQISIPSNQNFKHTLKFQKQNFQLKRYFYTESIKQYAASKFDTQISSMVSTNIIEPQNLNP